MKPAKKRGAQADDREEIVARSANLVPIKGGAPVEVLTTSETYANSVHLQIMGLLKQYQETYFELAKSLFDVSAKRLYRQMDDKYPSFQLYVEEAVGIDFRKAKYLVSIWWWYGVEQGADPKLLQGAHEIGWCVHPDTLVTTMDGAKPIWSIERGDHVMEATGQWAGVLEKMIVSCEDAFKIKAVKCDALIASRGHGFDVIREGVRHRQEARLAGRAFDRPVERVNAEKLCIGDMLVIPAISPALNVGEFGRMSEEFFEFAGWYVAEGFTYNRQIRISLGVNAEKERDYLFDIAKKAFPECSVKKNGNRARGTFRVTVSGQDIDRKFDEWFGVGAHNKKFPLEFYSLEKHLVRAFVAGLCGGDGSRSDKGTHVVMTTSRALAYQTRTLLTRLDVLAGVFHEKRNKRHDAWIVTLGRGDADDVLDEWKDGLEKTYAHYVRIPGGFGVPIRSIEAVEPDIPLVHLETTTGKFCCPVVSYNSKAKELVEVVDKKNADRWFGLAKSLNKKDLARAARAALKKAGKVRNRRQAPESVFEGGFDFNNGQNFETTPPVIDQTGATVEGESEGTEEAKEFPKEMRTIDPKPPKPPKGAAPTEPEPPPGVDVTNAQQQPSESEKQALEGVAPPENVEDAVAEEEAKSKEWTRMYFDVHREFKKTVKVALENAKREGDTEHPGYALSLICLHYLSFYSKRWDKEIGEWLRRIEMVTGLTLVAINERTDEIMYGGEFLDRLAGNNSEEENSAGKSGDGDAGDGGGTQRIGVLDSRAQGAEAG